MISNSSEDGTDWGEFLLVTDSKVYIARGGKPTKDQTDDSSSNHLVSLTVLHVILWCFHISFWQTTLQEYESGVILAE